MKPAPFEYHRPQSLAEALACLASLEDAKVLAGGQSLMAMMNYRYVTPAHLVDLNRIPELAGIDHDNDRIRIGAMTRQRDLLDSPVIQQTCPLMAEALSWVGHIQTRNRGTIGGSLSHLDPSAELPGVLAALDATLEVHGPHGIREVSIHEWPVAYMTPALEADELLVAIHLSPWPVDHGYGFRELARRHGDFAMAGAAALVTLSGDAMERVAIALVGVDDGPVRLREAESFLSGRDATNEAVRKAARFAADVPGIEDVHASAQYRRKIAVVMVRKALEDALARAQDHRP
jgi:carbon-monoxide dehydrogenase medium subunit